MSDHLSTQLLERYRGRRLEPAELLALDDHLATCAACRERWREMRPGREALLSLRASLRATNQAAPAHLPDEQLKAYAAGRLDEADRELAESHLDFCPHCAAQAQALRHAARRPAPPPAPRANPVSALSLSSLREHFLRLPLTLRAVGAVAVAALPVLAVVLWSRTQADRQEIVIHPPTPSPASSPPPVSPPPGPQPAPPAPAVLALNDGGSQITLDAQGQVAGVESLSPAAQQLVKTALTTQKVETPETLRELSDPSGVPMGGATGATFALLSPVGRIVATTRPTFRWRPLGGALGYQVTITDPAAGYKEVAASPELQDTKWTVGRPLERGRVYNWQVTARTDGGEVRAQGRNTEARFKVLEQAQAEELARAEKAYAGRHLVLGLSYAQAGLLDEAEREFRALVAANPGSPLAKKLLRDVGAKRRTR